MKKVPLILATLLSLATGMNAATHTEVTTVPRLFAVYGSLATNLYAKSMNVLFASVQDNVTLTNFPVLVRLSTAIDGFRYSDFNRPNGGDLRFADANGNLLPHEIDTWDESGVSTVWVRVPALKKKSYITAHYGFTGTGDPAEVDPKDVWDDDYVGVWHLGESALPLKESSETSSDFETSYGETINYATNGIVGGSVGFPTNGTYNAVVAPDHDALDGFTKFTLETWTFQNEHKHNAGILAKRKEYNNECAYYIYDVIGDSMCVPFCIGTNRTAGARWSFNQTQPMGQWNHIVFTADMVGTTKNVHGYMNGTMNGWEPNVTFLGQMGNCASDLYLGNLGANKKDNSFNGRIDEVRISKTVRSKEWVKATHDTIRNTGFAVCSFGEIDFGESITNLLLKARTDKSNPIDYVENETIRFDFWLDGVVALPLEVKAMEPLYVIWTRTADDGVTVKGTNAISLAEGFSMTTSLATNGIVKLTGTLVGSDYRAISYVNPSDGKTKNITFGGGAGVATEKMQLSTVEPADFDQFWAEAKAKLATVPFEGNVELVDVTPSNISSSYTIYAAKVPCFGPRPVTGWLTVPKNLPAGGVPIQATFDGYGCATTAPKVPTYGAGQLVRFAVNAHGYDMIGHDDQYYQNFSDYINYTNRTFNGTRYGYAVAPQDYDNPTNTYFYYMAMRVMRAFDYLKTRPEWNGTDVYASGGSQGGLQTMWAGGLVDGITQIKPSITWGCDIGCPWNGQGPYPSRTWGIPSVPGAFYFDSALHAKRVPRDCIANITRLGMGDYTCPPRGVLLSYYNMKCQVTADLVQGSDHGYVPPAPNQTCTISKAAMPDDPPEPPAPQAVATDEAGYDYTNRVVTVRGATADESLTLTLSTPDGTAVGTVTATADSEGVATFDIATAPGSNYVYAVSQDGGATIASGSFLSGGWNADGAWFLAVPDGQGGSTEVNGTWTTPPSATNETSYIVGESAVFALTTDALAVGSNKLVRVETGITYPALLDSVSPSPRQSIANTLAALVAMTNSAVGGVSGWMAYVGGQWVSLSGAIAPAAGTPYVVRLEGDFTLSTPRVRLSVSDDGGTTFAPLSDAVSGAEWLQPTDTAKRVLAEVVTEGASTVDGIRGTLSNVDVVTADGTGYASLQEALESGGEITLLTNATWPTNAPAGTVVVNRDGYSIVLPPDGVTVDGNSVIVSAGLCTLSNVGNIFVNFTDLAGIGIVTAGRTPAQIAAALLENGANGIPKWESYVLGLDARVATARPYADIAAGTAENTVAVSLGGVTVNESAGATVTYRVYEVEDLADFASVGLESESASTAPGVPVSFTTPDSNAKFFRVKVFIDVP